MLIQRIKNNIDVVGLKEDLRKMGINFITAGIAGVFINHLVGSELRNMLYASLLVTTFGVIAMYAGLRRRKV